MDEQNHLVGIVTSWDVAKATALGKKSLSEVMTTRVVTVQEADSIDLVSGKLSQHNISGIPVVDNQNCVVGIVTASDVAKFVGRQL